MAEIKIKINDNSDKILEQLDNKMPEILKAFGNELYKNIYDYMTADNIVDTGRLRGSISYCTPDYDYKNPTPANKSDDFIKGVKEENTVVFGSNVGYAS